MPLLTNKLQKFWETRSELNEATADGKQTHPSHVQVARVDVDVVSYAFHVKLFSTHPFYMVDDYLSIEKLNLLWITCFAQFKLLS